MNSKTFKLITIMCIIIIFLAACSSEYSKQVEKYETLYNSTMNLLDSEKVYESIKDNNLISNLDQLNKLLNKIEENVPDNRINDFIVLRTKHESIEEIIKKGLEWDSLGGLDKFLIKEKINIFKSN